MTTYLLFKSKSGSYFCTPDNWAQQKASDDPKDPSYYVMSFECDDVDKAFETFQVYQTEPEIFLMTHQQLILEVFNLRKRINKHKEVLEELEAEAAIAKETEEIHKLSEEARAEDAENYLLVKEDE